MSNNENLINNDTIVEDDIIVDIDNNKDHVIEDLTREYTTAIIMGTNISDKTTRELRSTYLEHIEEPDWEDFFCEFGKKLMSKLENIEEDSSVYDTPYSIGMNGKTYELTKPIITIGRYEKCDITTDSKNTFVSRLNAIVFVQPSRIIVIDPGSFRGIKTIMRENANKSLEKSIPHRHKPLVFGRTEKFVLELGIGVSISFSPKICIVCMDRPREILQVCGHYCMCRLCFLKLKKISMKCPICKKNMENGKVTHQIKTYIVNVVN